MGTSLAQNAYNNLLYSSENRDPWASELVTRGWLNPSVDDMYSPDTANRVFQQNILPTMSWQDLLKASFQEQGGNMGSPSLPVYDNLVRRLEATGWSDEQKKQAILNAANTHFAQYGSSYTGWSPEEGIAGLLGLPDYNPAAHTAANQQYDQAHTTYSAQADADSFKNALQIGSVIAAPFVVGGLTAAGAIPAGVVEGAGTGAALTGAGASAGVGAGAVAPTVESIGAGILGGENAAGAMYGAGTAAGATTGASTMDLTDWFTQALQDFNPDLGFQGLNEAGSGLVGGTSPPVDWSSIDQMIQNLGPNAGEAENLATVAAQTGITPSMAKTVFDALKSGATTLQQFMKDNPWAAPVAGAILGAVGGTQQPHPTVTTNEPWAPASPYLTTAMNQAMEYGSSPLPYANAGEMVAPLTEMQQAGAGITRNILTNRTLPFLKAAYTGATPFVNGDMMNVDSNPYLAAAIDAANRPVTQSFTEQVLPTIRGQYAGDDYNNSRQGVAEGIATRGYLQTIADNAARMANQGYQTGMNATTQVLGQAPNLVSAGLVPGQQMYNMGALLQGQDQMERNARGAFDQLQLARIQNPFNIYSTAAGRGSTQTVAPPTANPFTSAIGGALVGSQIQNFASPPPPR